MPSEYILIASTQDPAGITMVKYLCEGLGFRQSDAGEFNQHSFTHAKHPSVKLHVSSESLIHLENLDQIYPRATAFIFLSKHKSESKIPTLTCHCTGNFGENPFGGNRREIAISYPSLQKRYLQALYSARQRVPTYDIVIEATHHGPTSLQRPVLFAELGSSEDQWEDTNAASVICDVLLELLGNGFESCKKVGIAMGGTHYPTKFSRLLLESEFGLAAVASKHNLEAVDGQMMDQMLSKSVEQVTSIVLDSKGLGSQKDRIMKMAEDTGLEVIKV